MWVFSQGLEGGGGLDGATGRFVRGLRCRAESLSRCPASPVRLMMSWRMLDTVSRLVVCLWSAGM